MSLLPAELLRWLEQFQLLAARCVELVATPALTPALSPRRGRILRRVWRNRQPSVRQSFSPENHPPAATALQLLNQYRTLASDSLSSGERARVRAGVTPFSNSKEHRTSNIEHPTPDAPVRAAIGCSPLDVGCWMFPCPLRLPFPLPGGEGQGEGERHTNFKETSNIEPRTLNIERAGARSDSAFDVRCSMFDVSRRLRPPRLHSRCGWTIVPHASARRYRRRRVGRVVCHDALGAVARQWRIVGALFVHRRFA